MGGEEQVGKWQILDFGEISLSKEIHVRLKST